MVLDDDDKALLLKDYKAFLIRAWLCLDNPPTCRQCAEILGVSPATCSRLMQTHAKRPKMSDTKDIDTPPLVEQVPKNAEPSKPNTKKRTSKSKKPPTITTKLREVFDAYYIERTNMEFYWGVKEMNALKNLAEKVSSGMATKGIAITEEGIVENFKLLLKIITDPWILGNLSPSIINSKYNEIRATFARRGRQGGSSLEQQVDAILRDAGYEF